MTDERKKDLPVTPEQARKGAGGPGGPGPAGGSDAGSPPQVVDVPSWRLIATLALAGALAGTLIVGVFQWAQPQILEHRAQVLATAADEVLAGPDRVDRLFVLPDGLAYDAPAGVDTARAEKVYLGFRDGTPAGFAVVGAKAGFQDIIQIIFGYDPFTNQVLGMRVLESKETPGLGDKIFKDLRFVRGFEGVLTPIRPVGEGKGSGAPDEAELITGATISARVIVDIINDRVAALDQRLESFIASGLWAGVATEGGER
jgi:Na+-translocating ferredoxin:NAD+ oxidoreductase subunit G